MPRKLKKKKISLPESEIGEPQTGDKTIPTYQGIMEGYSPYPNMPVYQNPTLDRMPEATTMAPGFKEPMEIKEGGVVNEKEEKTPTQVIKENTTKDAAKIFIEEKIKARNEQIKRKTGQNYFDFVNGGLAKSSKNKKVRGSGAAIKGVRSAKIS